MILRLLFFIIFSLCFFFSILFVCLFLLHEICLTLIWFMEFNASCNNISVISWQSFLMVEETGVLDRRKTTDLSQVWAGFELTTLVVIGTDCTCSWKANYHSITTTTAPLSQTVYETNLHIEFNDIINCQFYQVVTEKKEYFYIKARTNKLYTFRQCTYIVYIYILLNDNILLRV